MSKLTYRVGLEIPTLKLKVYSLDFSPCGTKLTAGMENGDIFVWDAFTGSQYYPTLTSPRITATALGPSVVTWLDETSFLCAFSDGYIATCRLQKLSDVPQSPPRYRLHVLRRQATNETVKYLTYDKGALRVAVSGAERIRLWNRKDDLDWEHWKTLAKPSSLEERKSFPVEVTSSSWLSDKDDKEKGADHLIISYLHNGIVIWDVNSGEAIRSINAGGVIFGGVWCTEVQKFVAINGLRKVDVYDLDSGQIWSPECPDNVSMVKSIHRGSGFVAGCYMGMGQQAHLDLVDISECLILQSLHDDISTSTSPAIRPSQNEESNVQAGAIAVHQDLLEENFMIAATYQGKCAVWKTAPAASEFVKLLDN